MPIKKDNMFLTEIDCSFKKLYLVDRLLSVSLSQP